MAWFMSLRRLQVASNSRSMLCLNMLTKHAHTFVIQWVSECWTFVLLWFVIVKMIYWNVNSRTAWSCSCASLMFPKFKARWLMAGQFKRCHPRHNVSRKTIIAMFMCTSEWAVKCAWIMHGAGAITSVMTCMHLVVFSWAPSNECFATYAFFEVS